MSLLRFSLCVLVLACTWATSAEAAPPRTMRVDLFHSGDASTEHFAVDRVLVEPLPFPGNPARALDDLDLGLYLLEVRDRATHRVIYSRGFASIFGEWQTTADAKERWQTFSESVRFPRPDGPVQIVISKRDGKNAFRALFSEVIDPNDMFVRDVRETATKPIALVTHGDPQKKLDLLVLGDGYTARECAHFEKRTRELLAVFFATEPFKSRKSDFNVWGLCPPAAQSGVSRPSTGVQRDSPLRTTYDAFGSERYVLAFDNRAVRDVAMHAPYDFMVIVTNTETYGGGGIHQLYATVAAENTFAPYIFVHELGHHIAGLADEYFTSDVAYQQGALVEPWEKNVTTVTDPARLKWKTSAGAPLPTPWDKAGFVQRAKKFQDERKAIRKKNGPEKAMDALFLAQKDVEQKALGAEAHAKTVGLFEGASYVGEGMYRSQVDCIMFTRNDVPFCGACASALTQVIDAYVR